MTSSATAIPTNFLANGTAPFARFLTKSGGKASPEAIDKAAKEFESTFISQMMEPMFGDSIGDEAFGDKESADIYKGMLAEQYGNIIQKAGGMGIADAVKRELIQLQEYSP